MIGILIYPAIVARVTLAFLSAHRWLLVDGATIVACFVACGSLLSKFEFAATKSPLDASLFGDVSARSGALRAGVFGPLADLRLLGLGLLVIIVVWIARALLSFSRGAANDLDPSQVLITLGVLAVLAWVLLSYQL